MKILCTGLLAILASCFTLGQTYSSIVSDYEIECFIQWEIKNTPKYSEDRKLGKKILLSHPVSWKETAINIHGPDGDSLTFENKFYSLLKEDTLFSQADWEFIKKQYDSEAINNWKTKFEGVKLKKHFDINSHEIAIPLFSLDKSKVIFYKYFLCGNLCAYACIYIYEKTEENTWKLINKHGCWIS